MIGRLLRKPLTWVLVAVLAAGATFGLYWFQPWKLFTDKEVQEALPTVVESSGSASASPAAPTSPSGSPSASPAGNRLLATGSFITHEHDTSGAARLVRLADGRHQLLLVGLRTSDGPDLRVWLSDQPVRSGEAGWRVFDDGRWVELGRLKGNRGNQVYEIPAGTDLETLRSVSIWCKRFAVSFGAAALRPA
ncbi:MAG TPA: DM13 domain-containing protein [Pilimelia sp.]|nr:DM13 domain-containing protein [Pilimelia sp.]